MHELTTTADVVETLGGIAEVAKLTGRKYNAVSNWKAFGSFPADTYIAMTSALAERGCSAPHYLWRMVEPVQ